MTTRLPMREVAGAAAIVIAVGIAAYLSGSVLAASLAALLSAVVVAWVRTESQRQSVSRVRDEAKKLKRERDQWQSRWSTLEQESTRTASALSLIRDGVIILSSQLVILLANPKAQRLLALSADQELTGRPFGEVVRNPEIARAVAAAQSGDGLQKLAVEIHDGERVRPLDVHVVKFAVEHKQNLLITLRDETEARRVDEMRREFVANISHELKTPLAAIKGYAETVELAIKDDPDAAVHFMTQIHSQCLRLERLASDMMQLARAQAGRSNLKIGGVSLGEVFAESLKSYRPVAEAKNVQLSVIEPEDHFRVWSDPEATLTITNNLIGNAINYTPSGGQVKVLCRDAGKYCAIVVEDTGVGISEAEQSRIFERFYRVERGRSSADGGTGIGLSIVKNLTMTLGGEVRLSSKPGKGSKFEVLLRRELPNPVEVANP